MSYPLHVYRYPSLRVAYIDEKEMREKDKIHKEYYSVLIKAVNGLDEVVFFFNC
jgi:callose synthase